MDVLRKVKNIKTKAHTFVNQKFNSFSILSNGNVDKLLLRLEKEREVSAKPHLINARMNDLEFNAGKIQLRSYPVYVSINLIGLCNARCQFCYYADNSADTSRIELEEIKRMRWLKNISTVDLYGGVGEPFLLKDFPDIVGHLRLQNPTQALLTTSNGQLLTESLSERLAGKLTRLSISINAATEKTYETLMQRCSWKHLMKNLHAFQRINRSLPTPTVLAFSYVANRTNIEELPELAKIAESLGVHSVGINHFSTGGVWVGRQEPRLSRKESLYYYKELFDTCIENTKKAFKKAGVRLGHPPLFSEKSLVYLGTRAHAHTNIPDVFTCKAPWQTAYINPDPRGKWVSCCCCVNASHGDLTPLDLDDVDFKATWNSELFKMMRQFVNTRKLINCNFCRSFDKSSVESNILQLKTMITATQQYYNLMGREFSSNALKDIDDYQKRVEELEKEKTLTNRY